MASITQRGKRFLVRVRRDGFPTVTKTFTKRADAQAWGRQVEADMEAGRWVAEAQDLPTLAKAIGDYRTTVAAKMKGAADYSYRFDLFEALPFASKPIDEVTPFDLSKWRDDLSATRKPATVVRLLAMMSAIFTWAMKERGWIKTNPACMVARPRVSDRRERVLSEAEQRYINEAAATSRAAWLSPALSLLMSSAMRRGELFALRRQDVDLAASVAYLHDTKNGRPRAVPLAPAAMSAIGKLLDAAPARADAPLLPVGDVGSVTTRFKVTIGRARATYEADCAAKGEEPSATFLSDIRLHDARHHAITAAASRGDLNLAELMMVSGHTRPDMVMRYTHMSASALAVKLARASA